MSVVSPPMYFKRRGGGGFDLRGDAEGAKTSQKNARRMESTKTSLIQTVLDRRQGANRMVTFYQLEEQFTAKNFISGSRECTLITRRYK